MSETWCKEFCPQCKAVNWVYLGDLNDLTLPDVEGIKCHSCQHIWEIEAEEEMPVDELYIVDGIPTPT